MNQFLSGTRKLGNNFDDKIENNEFHHDKVNKYHFDELETKIQFIYKITNYITGFE